MKGFVYLGAVGLIFMAVGNDCAAQDNLNFEGSIGAGILEFESYDSFETGFVRGTALYGKRFKIGLEGEYLKGLSSQKEDGFYFENRTFVLRDKLSYAVSGFLISRYETGDFGIHGRLGYRDIKIESSITYDGERVVPSETNADALEIGIGAIYRIDKKRHHGIRADLGTSALFDQDDPSFYNGLGSATVLQVSYSYKF